MKNLLYHKNKDKVYPSPSLSLSSSRNNNKDDVLSRLLPAAILLHVSVLPLEDHEVLSYLLTMSPTSDHHKPLFDCGCFDCYTNFWSRWDSSPNRQLIHTVIEAFEQHLSKRTDHELVSSSSKHRAGKKKKDRMGFHKHQKKEAEMIIPESEPEKKHLVKITEEEDAAVLSECMNEMKENEEVKEEEQETVVVVVVAVAEETEEQDDQVVVTNGGHKGLARMVLPDLLGILNSRLWSLWSPNV